MREEQDAAYTLSFAQKTQVVKIQSFMDAEYQKYRTSMPEAAVVEPEPIIRAKWARANYYTMLRKVVPVFEPELAIHQVAEAKRGRCFQLLAEVTEAQAEMIPKAVQDEWAQTREKLPSLASREVLNIGRDACLKERYYAIVEEVVAGRKDCEARAAYVFQPLWSPAEAGDAEEQKLAAKLVSEVQEADVGSIDKAVEKEWSAAVLEMSAYFQQMPSGAMRATFLHQRYFPIIYMVVAARQANEAPG